MILSCILKERFGSKQQPHIFAVESLMTDCKTWLSFFVGVIELGDRNTLKLGDGVEMKMIEVTHFPAFVLAPFEKLALRILKCSFIEQFLGLINPFLFIFAFILNLIKYVPLVLR